VAQTEAHLPAASRAAAARRTLRSPANLIPFPVFGVLVLARHYHFVANQPLWLILGAMVLTQICTTTVAVVFPPGTPDARPRLLLTTQIVLTGLCVYVDGWGSLLAVGFVFAAATAIHSDGYRYAWWAMVLTVLTILAGETVVGLGWLKSMVPPAEGHGLAVMEVAATCAVIWILAYNQREKETVEQSLRSSEGRFRALVQHASDIIMVVTAHGTISYASPAFESILGYSSGEAIGMVARTIMDPEDPARLAKLLEQTSMSGHVARAETRLKHHDGSWHWFESTFTNLFDDPGVGGWVANLRDISERRQSDAALRQAQEVFRHAFDEAGIGMTLVDPSGCIIRSNEAMAQMLRYPDGGSLAGVRVVDITHPDDRPATNERIHEVATGARDGFRMEKRLLRCDGETVWVALTSSCVHDDRGGTMFTIEQLEDISERKAFSDRLRYEAEHDVMTGLLNRASFSERVAALLAAGESSGRNAAVLFIDLDRFKLINDSLGHAAGDDLLVTVAQRLRATLRPGDLLARFGGDEFVLLCTDVAGNQAVSAIAQRLIGAIAEPIMIGDDEVFVTASVGIAVAREGDTPATLLRHADAAMYQAKHDGRARAVVFRPDLHGTAAAALKTGNDLHRALDRDELVLHYQPIIDLRTGRVIGFEALLRWSHPERGLLSPADFIPFAEETGLIVPIGAWALETACAQTAHWQRVRDAEASTRRHPLSISVNLAARQVADRTLAKVVADIISRTGIAPEAIVLELTENTLMLDTASTIDALHALRSQGVHLSIDDFGTGYSSLSYLKRFPVEALKIDRTFISGLGRETEDTSIVEAIIRLAHALELSAVAEGLETPTQLETLRTLGCDFAQGYLLGRPLPATVIGDRPADDLTPWQDHTAPPAGRVHARADAPDQA
jgi:diguanylate cyclase (GGDEF)-like protein/PAS domain S-box-containing protein